MRKLASRDELIEWVEDEGALDDSIVLAVSEDSITIGLRILEDAGNDPRAAFRRKKEQVMPFTLTAEDGTVVVEGVLEPNAEFESALLESGDAFGIAFEMDGGTVNALARAWSVETGEPIEIEVVPELSEAEITFHGNGPLTSTLVRDALKTAGVSAQLFGNWNGSGHSFGAAFVRKITTPALAPDEKLGGAWRVVPDGAEATDPRGVWISGNASATSAYATVERTAESDSALVGAVLEALASLPGLAWASSGNQLVEDAAAREAWVRLAD